MQLAEPISGCEWKRIQGRGLDGKPRSGTRPVVQVLWRDIMPRTRSQQGTGGCPGAGRQETKEFHQKGRMHSRGEFIMQKSRRPMESEAAREASLHATPCLSPRMTANGHAMVLCPGQLVGPVRRFPSHCGKPVVKTGANCQCPVVVSCKSEAQLGIQGGFTMVQPRKQGAAASDSHRDTAGSRR